MYEVYPSVNDCTPVAIGEIKVFLAEDHDGDVFLVKRALGRMTRGYNLTLARNGEEALKLLNLSESADEIQRPDVILLDLNLPRIGGIELLSRIREAVAFRDTPVLIFTSSDSPRDRETALQLGATRYVRKPTALSSFMALGYMIEELVSGRNNDA